MKKMFDEILNAVQSCEWEKAAEMLEKVDKAQWDDDCAVLAATTAWNQEDYEKCFEYIKSGLEYNYKNYELYLLLGNYYERVNPYQAALCYDNSLYYCNNEEDYQVIEQFRNNLGIDIPKTAIVILSYNLLKETQACIESIRLNNASDSYELIVVDNGSEAEVVEWLSAQSDIKLLCNKENKGFPYGCNQGIKMAEPESDILLLNNDTIVAPNSIFWLRMGLYSEPKVGATGSVSNRVSNEQVVEIGHDLDTCMKYAVKNNIPMRYAYEEKIFLIGFAMLIRREAMDEVGLLDIRFSPGTYEDNDYGIRLHKAGWHVYLCHNSFIYHLGGGGGKNRDGWRQLSFKNYCKFKEKWGFELEYYKHARTELLDLIEAPTSASIKVLEVGCGFGATLNRLRLRWPNAEVHGIEYVRDVAEVASQYMDILCGDVETLQLPYEDGQFDYIIFGDVLEHLREPKDTLLRMKRYLKTDGQYVCSIPNFMHTSVIVPLLLRGELEYRDAGILDRTHLRFFTLTSIYKMFFDCNMTVRKVSGTISTSSEDFHVIEQLSQNVKLADLDQFVIYQYIFTATKNKDE